MASSLKEYIFEKATTIATEKKIKDLSTTSIAQEINQKFQTNLEAIATKKIKKRDRSFFAQIMHTTLKKVKRTWRTFSTLPTHKKLTAIFAGTVAIGTYALYKKWRG